MGEATPPDDGGLSGGIEHLAVDVHAGGYLLTEWGHPRLPSVARDSIVQYTPRRECLAADRDELAVLVRRLMAAPPEGRAR
jgi:hypothetical protein